MLTYQVRPRIFRTTGNDLPPFPVEGQLQFHFAPAQPFGEQAGGGRTAVKAVPASVMFNANTGEHFIESKPPLNPLDVTIQAPDQIVRLDGTRLTLSQTFDSLTAVAQAIDVIYFAVPVLLAVEFADPPFPVRVDGTLGGVPFRWELENWKGRFRTTTQDKQEEAFARAWERMSLLTEPTSRRLFAALHYYHVAARLSRVAASAGEFLPEMLLNLSKVLEVLFPPAGDGKTRDAVRSRLAQLGFDEAQIERDYLPAMALRNEIDVGHVDLSIFNPDQLQLIHDYAERAEGAFRVLLARVLEAIEQGRFAVPPYEISTASATALKVIEKLREHAHSAP